MNFFMQIKSLNTVKPIDEMTIKQVVSLLRQDIAFSTVKKACKLPVESLSDLLVKYSKQKHFNHEPLLLYFSKTHLLEIIHILFEQDQSIKKNFILKNWYPLLLVIFSFLMVIFFYQLVLPSFQHLSTGINTKPLTIFYVVLVLIFLIVGLCMVGLIIFLKVPHQQVLLFNWLYRKQPHHLLFTYYAYLIAILLLFPLKLGYSSQHMVMLLRQLPKWPYLKKAAYDLDHACLQGLSFSIALQQLPIDPTWQQFVQLGLYKNDLALTIQQYIMFAEKSIAHAIDVLSVKIKITSYVFVLLCLFFIYTILQLPISAISSTL